MGTEKGSSMKILLINGPPRSGKDALGIEVCRRVFRAASGWHAQRRKFATALKEMTHRLYDITDDYDIGGHVEQDAFVAVEHLIELAVEPRVETLAPAC